MRRAYVNFGKKTHVWARSAAALAKNKVAKLRLRNPGHFFTAGGGAQDRSTILEKSLEKYVGKSLGQSLGQKNENARFRTHSRDLGAIPPAK